MRSRESQILRHCFSSAITLVYAVFFPVGVMAAETALFVGKSVSSTKNTIVADIPTSGTVSFNKNEISSVRGGKIEQITLRLTEKTKICINGKQVPYGSIFPIGILMSIVVDQISGFSTAPIEVHSGPPETVFSINRATASGRFPGETTSPPGCTSPPRP